MKKYSAVILALLVPCFVLCQESGSVTTYSLEECITIALQNNFDVKLSNAQAQAAAANLTQAFGEYLPSADITTSYNRQLTNLTEQISFVNGVPLIGQPRPNNYSLNASASWTIFNGFARESQYDAARVNLDATQSDVRYNRQLVAYNVKRQYIEVMRLLNIVESRAENLALSKATYQRVKALYENGRSPITQLLSQETEVANQEVSVVQAENDVENAKARLLGIMCVNPSDRVRLREESISTITTVQDIEQFRAQLGTEESSVQRSLNNRADVQAARMRKTAAQSRIDAAAAGYYPTITASGGYNWRNTEITNFDKQGQMYAGFSLRLPLFDQFQTNQQIETAQLQHTQRSIDEQRLEQQIRTNVRSAYLQLAAAEKGLTIAERAFTAANTNFQATQERFNVGNANLLDVQTANNQLITARVNKVTAVYAYLDARTFVEFATGLFSER